MIVLYFVWVGPATVTVSAPAAAVIVGPVIVSVTCWVRSWVMVLAMASCVTYTVRASAVMVEAGN